MNVAGIIGVIALVSVFWTLLVVIGSYLMDGRNTGVNKNKQVKQKSIVAKSMSEKSKVSENAVAKRKFFGEDTNGR